LTGEKGHNVSIVFVNGCFDLFAIHHLRFLERAAQYGDWLVVGLNSDRSVRELKGPGRPFYPEQDRQRILEALSMVGAVHIFDSEDELDRLVSRLRPDVMVKGEEYRDKPITGAQHAKRLVILQGTFSGGITEGIVKRIREGAIACQVPTLSAVRQPVAIDL